MTEQEILDEARAIARRRMLRKGAVMNNPDKARDALERMLGHKPNECFAVLFLDQRHRVVAYRELFHGTINGTSVHPRVVAQAALAENAAAVILAHNHPSGVAEPSAADRSITRRLEQALNLFDIQVLDHVVVGWGETVSFRENGWL